jgi:hypothetical protein
MLINLSPRTDPKYVGWALAREALSHPGVTVEHGTAQAIFDAATHTFTLTVAGHGPVVVKATGPRSTRVFGSPLPVNYNAFYYLVEGFIDHASDPTAPNLAFTEPS